MVEIQNLSKKFGDSFALKDINLKIDEGSSVCIIGPSGSGKTTLLRMINRMIAPSGGRVLIGGTEISEKNKLKMRGQIGMAFQSFNLFPHLSVIENLTVAPKIRGGARQGLEKKARALLKEFGMSSKASSYPADLSGGQCQRVSIARALMLEPQIMLFDEPTSALDPENIKDVVEIIQALRGKMTIITVTHHLKFAQKIADRIVFMDKGQVLCDQTRDAFLKKPSSQRARIFMQNISALD